VCTADHNHWYRARDPDAQIREAHDGSDPEQAADFEPRYMLGAMLYAGVLGLWCAVVLLGTDDPIAHMLCTTVTIAYTGGGAARNYGRPRIVQLHILLSCGPMSSRSPLMAIFITSGSRVCWCCFSSG
jgi:hypothetical protein